MINFGKSSLSVPAVGYGCLQLSFPEMPDEQAISLILSAYAQGVRFFDTAAAYGINRHNEKLLGKALTEIRAKGGEMPVVATKCGIAFDPSAPFPQSPEQIRASVEESLTNLGVNCLDILYLHRVNPQATEIEFYRTINTLKQLVKEGKVKYIGLSDCHVKWIREAQRVAPLDVPITSIELPYSLFSRRAELNGVYDACQEFGIGMVAYTSLVRGATNPNLRKITPAQLETLDDASLQELVFKTLNIVQEDPTRTVGFFAPENIRNNVKQLIKFQEIAERVGVTPSQLSLAWLKHRGMVSIPATTSQLHLRENAAVLAMNIPASELEKLTVEFPAGCFVGSPNPSMLSFLDDDSLEPTSSAARPRKR